MGYSVFWRLWRVGSVRWEMLEALEVVEVLEAAEAMRCVFLCMLEAVKVGIYLLGGVERARGDGDGCDALSATLYVGGCGGWALFAEVVEVMRVCYCVCWRLWRVGSVCGGDALYATLFAGGRR